MASLNREGVGGAQSHILEPRPCYLGGIILKRGGVDKVSRGMAPSCLIQLCLLPLEVVEGVAGEARAQPQMGKGV